MTVGRIRKHRFFRLFWFLMALHILNLSVDSPDPQPIHIPEDLGYNDMESIVEIFLELVLEIEDAIPESDDDDSTQGLLAQSGFQLDCYQPNLGVALKSGELATAALHGQFSYDDPYSSQFHPEVVPPPPKA